MEHDAISDYGSDFTPDEEEILHALLLQGSDASAPEADSVLTGIEDHESPYGARVPRILSQERQQQSGSGPNTTHEQTSHIAVEMADNSTAPTDEPDLRSPLERFRTKPKKAFSVTDLVSPSWCELQYWFVLTKHGKKRRTPAMKRGSAVHKTLEDEVHTTVAVNIKTKEDAWGLQIWNIIQGLRTLRETGMTRELEVWGVIDGQVVRGVIDELSYTCPDRELEASEANSTKSNESVPPPTDQRSITDFLSPNGSSELSQSNFGAAAAPPISSTFPTSKENTQRIYITDTKTRSTASVPKGASFRPTLMQLMLYHRLLSDMATGAIDPAILFSRYDLDADAPFTDAFIAQIGEIYNDASTQSTDYSSFFASDLDREEGDTMTLLLAHNSLTQLWTLLVSAFKQTFPHGAASVGNVLQTVYRRASTGEIMKTQCVLNDSEVLDSYLNEEMKWWKGEREAVGVCLEEAYKCGSCEFADECHWRKGKIEEAKERVRMTREKTRSKV
ncbi:MAG: hypothetical protein Q9218_006129 [Villophora microphyllina]